MDPLWELTLEEDFLNLDEAARNLGPGYLNHAKTVFLNHSHRLLTSYIHAYRTIFQKKNQPPKIFYNLFVFFGGEFPDDDFSPKKSAPSKPLGPRPI